MSISPTGRGHLVKMLLTLKPQGIFWIKVSLLVYFNIVQPLRNGNEAPMRIIT